MAETMMQAYALISWPNQKYRQMEIVVGDLHYYIHRRSSSCLQKPPVVPGQYGVITVEEEGRPRPFLGMAGPPMSWLGVPIDR